MDTFSLSTRSYLLRWLKKLPKAIEEPNAIFKDADFPDRQVYYYLTRKRYIKVVVRFDNSNGEVVTVFLTDSPKSGETLIWSR